MLQCNIKELQDWNSKLGITRCFAKFHLPLNPDREQLKNKFHLSLNPDREQLKNKFHLSLIPSLTQSW